MEKVDLPMILQWERECGGFTDTELKVLLYIVQKSNYTNVFRIFPKKVTIDLGYKKIRTVKLGIENLESKGALTIHQRGDFYLLSLAKVTVD